jgi:hypothetical protein
MLQKIINFFKKNKKEEKIPFAIYILRNSERVKEFKVNMENQPLESLNSQKRINNLLSNNFILMFNFKNYLLSFETDDNRNPFISVSDMNDPLDFFIDKHDPLFHEVFKELVNKMNITKDKKIHQWLEKYYRNALFLYI